MTETRKRNIPLYTIAQVAETCQVSDKTVRRWIATRELTAIRLGRQLRVSPEALEQLLRDRRL